MNVPHQQPHPTATDPLDRALDDLASSLNRELSLTGDSVQGLRERVAAAPMTTPAAPPRRPPVVAAGGGVPPKWGPSTPHVTAPLAVLEATAQSAYELHWATERLLGSLTGEEPQRRAVPSPFRKGPLLPTIVALASEIEAVLNEVRRLVEHMQGRL